MGGRKHCFSLDRDPRITPEAVSIVNSVCHHRKNIFFFVQIKASCETNPSNPPWFQSPAIAFIGISILNCLNLLFVD